MNKTDLKLESARVKVSNANQVDKVYSVEADFQTANHELQRVDGGVVRKDGETYATFYKSYEGAQKTTTYTFYQGAKEKSVKQEIMDVVEDFEQAAEAVVMIEANE